MKISREFLVVLGILTLFPGFTVQAQNSPPKHEDQTIWVDPRTGTLLGGGYTSSYLTNIRAQTIAAEDPILRNAIDSLDALRHEACGRFRACAGRLEGRNALGDADRTASRNGPELRRNPDGQFPRQQAKVSFARIVAMRAQTRTWGSLMKQIEADPDFIIARAKAAADAIHYAEGRKMNKRLSDVRTIAGVTYWRGG